MLGVQHPINDPALVSYHRPELVRLLPDLELARDCWVGLNGTAADDTDLKRKYLHKEPGEPKQAYEERLHRATYTPVYRDAIRGYAGLLSRFELIDVPQTLLDNQKNIDLNGSSIQSFLGICDELVLRDGGTYVMVDMLPDGGTNNYLDQHRDGRAPYLIQIDRADVINWQTKKEHGRLQLVKATIRQMQALPDPAGFGSKIEPVYYVLEPNRVSQYLVQKTVDGWQNVLVGKPIETTLPYVPLIWYGATSSIFAKSELPMQGLASLSLQHFQMRSDLTELLHKCAMPVPVRKGASLGPNGQKPALVLGPNTAVDLDVEGDFKFAEPTGQSLAQHQSELRHVEDLMDRASLNFLYGANLKTATEAALRSAQVSAQVSTMVRNKISMFFSVMRLWALYSGEESSITAESGLALNESLINKPIDSSGIAQLVNLHREKLVSGRLVLEELRRGGVLDPELQIDAELARIDEEVKKQQQEALDQQKKQMELRPAPTETQVSQAKVADGGKDQKAAQNQEKDKQGTTAAIGR